MKKFLSLMLVLVMTAAVIAVPAMASDPASDTLLPYKTETFARFRNALTGTTAANLALSSKNTVGVNSDELPLYGDSALIGVHEGGYWSEAFFTSPDINSNQEETDAVEMGIVADKTSTASGINHTGKALKLSASNGETGNAGSRGVSFGFVPNEVLSQVEGIYFKWDEMVVANGGNAFVIPQWVGADGLLIGNKTTGEYNIAEVLHGFTVGETFATHSLELRDNAYIYDDGASQSIELDLANPPEGAVGIKLFLEVNQGNFEVYYKNLEVGTIGGNMAALRGDALAYAFDATEVVVDFSAPVVSGDEDVKLYLENVEVEDAVYSWNAEGTALTITAPEALGTSKGYRVSTSKASTADGAIYNDVRFITTIKVTANATPVAPNKLSVYDLNGNALESSASFGDGEINISVYLSEGEETPNVIVPVFGYEGDETFVPDFFYNLIKGEDDAFATIARGAYPIVNGATAIPVKNFTLFQGGHNTRNASYNVTVSAIEKPEQVTAEISAEEGEDIAALGLLSPITVTFSHGITATDALAVTEDGEEYTAYTAEWSIDGTEVVLTPNEMWTLGAQYQVTIPEDASIFGDQVDVVATDLIFTATSEIPPAAGFATFELTDENLIYTFDAEGKTIAIIVKTEDEIDLTAVEFNATVDAVGAFVQISETSLEATEGVFTGTVDISEAEGIANAATIVVDNGFNVDTEYSIYYISAINPPVQEMDLATVESFENATVDERFTGGSIIASSGLGSFGAVSHSAGNSSNNAKVVQEGDNKFLRLTASKAGGDWVGLATVAVPKSFLQNASKIIFSYDVRQPGDAQNGRAGVGGCDSLTSTIGGAGQKSDLAGIGLFASGGAWKTWFAQGSFSRDVNSTAFLKPTGGTLYGDTSNPSWQNVEWVVENAIVPEAADRVDSYEGTIGTTINTRAKGTSDEEWREGAPSEVAAWNYKNNNYIRFFITIDGKNGNLTFSGDYDNFRIYAVSQDLATTVTYERGDVIAVGEGVTVTFKTPLMPGSEENFIFADEDGNTVDYTYSWSDDRLSITLVPEVEGNKNYTLSAEELVDVYENAIIVNDKFAVLPDVQFEDYEDGAEYAIIPGDYSQTLNVIYKYAAGAAATTMDVDFGYGSKTASVNGVKAVKPEDGDAFAIASIVVPEAVVASEEETVEISVDADETLQIYALYFEPGVSLEDINTGVSEDNEDTENIAVLKSMAESFGLSDEFNALNEEQEDEFVAALLEKLEEDGAFETLEDAKEWYTETLGEFEDTTPTPPTPGPSRDESNRDTVVTYPSNNYVETPAEAALTTKKFTDLGAASWAKTAINTLYEAGIVNGVSDTEFAPLKDVTREEFVKLIVVTFGIYDPFLTSSFKDVSSDAWYSSYIASAAQAGIVAGISADEFGVGQSITREQMATMLKRACDKYGVSLDGTASTTFKDSDSISDYAVSSVKALAKAGIINGISGSFAPQQVANRAMAAQVVYLVYSKM